MGTETQIAFISPLGFSNLQRDLKTKKGKEDVKYIRVFVYLDEIIIFSGNKRTEARSFGCLVLQGE